MENKTTSEKQANEIDTGTEGNSGPRTSEPAAIEKKNWDDQGSGEKWSDEKWFKNNFSLNDLNNEDEFDFSFKDLDEKELYAFCHAITSWQIIASYQLAEELWGSDANFEDKKKLTNEIFEKKELLI